MHLATFLIMFAIQSVTNLNLKYMKEQITGVITFLGGLACIGISIRIYSFNTMEGYSLNEEDYLGIALSLFFGISFTLYAIWTKFGRKRNSQLTKIELENEILKKKIEQKALKEQLGD